MLLVADDLVCQVLHRGGKDNVRWALSRVFAIQRAGLVVEQDEPAAMARADGVLLLGVAHRQVGPEDLLDGEGHALQDGQAGDAVGSHDRYSLTTMMAPAVTSTDIPIPAATPMSPMPRVPATVQELPMDSAVMAQSRQLAG